MVTRCLFLSLAKREAALLNFRDRGYSQVGNGCQLWPGEVRRTTVDDSAPALEWSPINQDPAAPLWERLLELHAAGAGELVGKAVVLLEQGMRPRAVFREIAEP